MIWELGIRVLAIFLGLVLISGISGASPLQSAFAIQADENGGPNAPIVYTDTVDDDNIVDVIEPIELVPGAGPWVKHLDASLAFPGLTVRETLTVTGAAEICDWHEELIFPTTPPGGAQGTFLGEFLAVNGQEVDPSFMSGSVIDWVFDPCLTAPDSIFITKFISVSAPTFVEIHQWPTPGTGNENGNGMAVGGELIPLDSTMILAAGAQYTAAWMIPVLVSAIGIGIVIARKF